MGDMSDRRGDHTIRLAAERDPERPAQRAGVCLDQGFNRDARAEITLSESDLLLVDAHLMIRSFSTYLDEVAAGTDPLEHADHGE